LTSAWKFSFAWRNIIMIKKITHNEQLLALIIPREFSDTGIHFFTPDDFSQQLAYMRRPKDYAVAPHVHNNVPREVRFTNEVLFVRSGRIRIDFFDDHKNYLESRVLSAGDVILLAHGGHGLTMLEESEIIEVKQGPYAGTEDKTRFKGITEEKIKIN
jgi:mannose-6-phosphate isomerase-like protein (cupin superfamily)